MNHNGRSGRGRRNVRPKRMPGGIERLNANASALEPADPRRRCDPLRRERRPIDSRGKAAAGRGRPWLVFLPTRQRSQRGGQIGLDALGFPPSAGEVQVGLGPGCGVKGVRQRRTGPGHPGAGHARRCGFRALRRR